MIQLMRFLMVCFSIPSSGNDPNRVDPVENQKPKEGVMDSARKLFQLNANHQILSQVAANHIFRCSTANESSDQCDAFQSPLQDWHQVQYPEVVLLRFFLF